MFCFCFFCFFADKSHTDLQMIISKSSMRGEANNFPRLQEIGSGRSLLAWFRAVGGGGGGWEVGITSALPCFGNLSSLDT